MSQNRTALVVLGLALLLCGVGGTGATLVGGTAYYLIQNQSTPAPAPTPAVVTRETAVPPPRLRGTSTPPSTPILITTATVAKTPAATMASKAGTSPAPTPTRTSSDTSTITPETTRRQQRIWDELWRIVNTNYVYKDFRGVNWPAEKTRVTALIASGISDARFHKEMENVIDNFDDDHSSFETPAEVRDDNDRKRGTGSYSGIGITTDVNQKLKYIYVLQVRPGSPAEAAGISAHDHILQVEGKPILDADGHPQTALLRGPSGSKVSLTVQTPGGKPREVTATRSKVDNNAIVESRLITSSGKKIGYILFPTFAEDRVDRKLRDALQKLNTTAGGSLDGLIVDVRHNGGGQFTELSAALATFTSGEYGRLVTRDTNGRSLNARANALGNSQSLPVAVLTGRSTASAAEIFAGALQFKKRAIVVGAPSSGNIEALLPHDFEDGSRAWIAQEAFQLSSGASWEGKGLIPDVPVAAEWDEFTGTNDPVIDAAVKALSK